jgi:hypothetical protein
MVFMVRSYSLDPEKTRKRGQGFLFKGLFGFMASKHVA